MISNKIRRRASSISQRAELLMPPFTLPHNNEQGVYPQMPAFKSCPIGGLKGWFVDRFGRFCCRSIRCRELSALNFGKAHLDFTRHRACAWGLNSLRVMTMMLDAPDATRDASIATPACSSICQLRPSMASRIALRFDFRTSAEAMSESVN